MLFYLFLAHFVLLVLPAACRLASSRFLFPFMFFSASFLCLSHFVPIAYFSCFNFYLIFCFSSCSFFPSMLSLSLLCFSFFLAAIYSCSFYLYSRLASSLINICLAFLSFYACSITCCSLLFSFPVADSCLTNYVFF